MIIALIAIGLVMIMITQHNQDSVVNGRPRGGYRLGHVNEVNIFDVGKVFASILNRYAFMPSAAQWSEFPLYKLNKTERAIFLNNGETISDRKISYRFECIEIKLFTGSRNTYNDATLIIYPDIEGHVGFQIKCLNDEDILFIMQLMYECQYSIDSVWLQEYENDYNLKAEFEKYPAFRYAN